jgi:transcriptional regulator with XRE-family HTH domain
LLDFVRFAQKTQKENFMEFWNIFFNLCNNEGESPNAVAKKLGISSASVTWWKQGQRNPSARTIKKIADYFDVSVDALKGNEALELAGLSVRKQGHIEPKRTELGQKENAPEYTEGERLLLDLFRSLPAERQELFLQMVKAFAEVQK